MSINEAAVQQHRIFFKSKKRTNLVEMLGRCSAIKSLMRAYADDLERDGFPPKCVRCWREFSLSCEKEAGECNLSGKSPAT